MSDTKPIEIKMRGAAGEVEMVIPYAYVCYYATEDKSVPRLKATIDIAISAYKALEPKS